MQFTFEISTDRHHGLYDITEIVQGLVKDSQLGSGMVNVYVRGATAAIMIQENWDYSVQTDVINLLNTLIPAGIWEHDKQDNNGDAHLKAGIIGPGETIPILNGTMGLDHVLRSSLVFNAIVRIRPSPVACPIAASHSLRF